MWSFGVWLNDGCELRIDIKFFWSRLYYKLNVHNIISRNSLIPDLDLFWITTIDSPNVNLHRGKEDKKKDQYS